MTTSILWLRRDLRLSDHPALLAAAAEASQVCLLFVLDDRLRGPSGAPRLAFLYGCLRDLDEQSGGRLCVRTGDPVEVVPRLAAELDAATVHVSEDFGPYGRDRDRRVEQALADSGRRLVRTGSPYAVSPGRVRKDDGSAYRVYTPFYRAWRAHGWRAPAGVARGPFADVPGEPVPEAPPLGDTRIPPAGEQAGLERMRRFLAELVPGYAEGRNLPGTEATSRLSVYLKYGCLHPRTLLAELGTSEGEEAYRGELAWRDFYADVLFQSPASARADLHDLGLRYDRPTTPDRSAAFEAWKSGRTGFPIVDAGMRQMLGEAWMHNRVRMITASFLCKDLHLWWVDGARWFMHRLVDGDLPSNQHGWQWVAGTGTDASPYFRIFNPVLQGQKFDPAGDYVRRWVPELRDVPGAKVHEPWKLPGGPPSGYPERIVDHAAERQESLRRYEQARG